MPLSTILNFWRKVGTQMSKNSKCLNSSFPGDFTLSLVCTSAILDSTWVLLLTSPSPQVGEISQLPNHILSRQVHLISPGDRKVTLKKAPLSLIFLNNFLMCREFNQGTVALHISFHPGQKLTPPLWSICPKVEGNEVYRFRNNKFWIYVQYTYVWRIYIHTHIQYIYVDICIVTLYDTF